MEDPPPPRSYGDAGSIWVVGWLGGGGWGAGIFSSGVLVGGVLGMSGDGVTRGMEGAGSWVVIQCRMVGCWVVGCYPPPHENSAPGT